MSLYREDGKLLFSGGVTVSRGHEGDSAGGDLLYAILSQKSPAADQSTPVFGCRLCVASSAPDCGDARHAGQLSVVDDIDGAMP